jgi:hypothetical protein
MVVRFVCVIRVPVCVPAPPVSFYRYSGTTEALVAGGWGRLSDRGSLARFAPFRAPRLGVLVQRVQQDARLLFGRG